MATDTERREVARRLRELRPGACFDDVYEALGAYGPNPYASRVLSATWFARYLADLIEPSCDRDALLAQVEELEKCAWYFGLDFDADEPLRDRLKEAQEDFAGCASRIREALWVVA